MPSKSLSDQMQIWGFENDTIIFSDSSFGFGLELKMIDVSCWDDSRSEGFSERVKQFLNGLPPGIDLQFILDIDAGNEPLLSQHAGLALEESSIARELAQMRVDRYFQMEKQGLLPFYRLCLFVRRTVSTPLVKKKGLFVRQKLFEVQTEEQLNEECQRTQTLRSEIIQGLKSIEIEPTPLTAPEIAALFYAQWNPRREGPIPALDYEDIRSDLLFTDVEIYDRGFSLSDLKHRIISLKRLPDRTCATMAAKLIDLPFGSRVFLSVGTLNQEKELSKLQTQRRFAFAMAKGKVGVSDIESESKLEDLESLIEQMVAQGEKVFQVSLNILLRSASDEELNNQVSETLIKLRELSSAEGMEETIASFDVFLEVSLPNARGRERARWIETSNLANFLPLYAPWSGHEKPTILLRSRHGSLLGFDPFSKDLPNFNHIVTGGSGAGKSFLANLLLLQTLKEL
jgi:conjugal transfer ATP-binding protein TraC